MSGSQAKSDVGVRLQDMPVERGEIFFSDVQAISQTMQQLSTRIAADLAGQVGFGRPPSYVSDAAALRWTGLTGGSTTLHIGFGRYGQQAFNLHPGRDEGDGDYPDDLQASTARRFWTIIESASVATPPEWTTASIAGSAVAVIRALGRAAPKVEFTRYADERKVSMATDVDTTAWDRIAAEAEEGLATVAGRLTLVDLDSAKFRIRDDVGNRITLTDVTDPEDAVGLTGARVQATGTLRRRKNGRISLNGVLVSPFVSIVKTPEDVRRVLARATPAEQIPHADLSVEQVYAMLASIDE